MTAGARVERAGRPERDVLLGLMREFRRGEGFAWDAERLGRALDAMWAPPARGFALLATVDAEPAGYAVVCFGFSLEYFGRDALLDELFVRPGRRGRKIGTALLRSVEEACREAGVEALHLEVDDDNEAGRRLYRRLGFVEHDRRLMTRRLAP